MRGTDTIKNTVIQVIKSLRDFIKHGYAVQKTEIPILPNLLRCAPSRKIAGECLEYWVIGKSLSTKD